MTIYYMNINTGSIDTLDGWIDETREGCTAEDVSDAIADGDLVEVVENIEGKKGYDAQYVKWREA